MERRTYLARGISALLLVAMLTCLVGCGRPGRTDLPSRPQTEEQTGPEKESQKKPIVETDTTSERNADVGTIEEDPTILAHLAHNESLRNPPDAHRPADTFRLYVENTEMMEGFCNNTIQYQSVIQSVFDTINHKYDSTEAFILDTPKGSSELQWTSKNLNSALCLDLQRPMAYSGNVLPDQPPLVTLCTSEESPFEENSVTMILSSFMENPSGMYAIAEQIENYFKSYQNSAACVIGITSYFDGTMYIPKQLHSSGEATLPLQNFNGDLHYYMVIVGPEKEVRSYSDELLVFLDNATVAHESAIYTNNVFDDIQEFPLDFDTIPDWQEKYAIPPVLSSYNTGIFTHYPDNTALFSSYHNMITRQDRSGRKAKLEADIPIDTSTQMSLVSTNYQEESRYTCDYSLYTYDRSTGEWADAGKNALTKARIIFEPRTSDQMQDVSFNKAILAPGRQEIYTSATLDFTDNDVLSRNKTYRLELRIKLNWDNTDAVSQAIGTNLYDFSAPADAYYDIVHQLSRLYEGYNWTGDWEGTHNRNLQNQADTLIVRTPNLSQFLKRLEELETRFVDDDNVYQYVDFVFNIPSAS